MERGGKGRKNNFWMERTCRRADLRGFSKNRKGGRKGPF